MIWVAGPGRAPRWFVSPLDAGPRPIRSAVGTDFAGFRLCPGVRLDEARVVEVLDGLLPTDARVPDLLGSLVEHDRWVEDALSLLADGGSVGGLRGASHGRGGPAGSCAAVDGPSRSPVSSTSPTRHT